MTDVDTTSAVAATSGDVAPAQSVGEAAGAEGTAAATSASDAADGAENTTSPEQGA